MTLPPICHLSPEVPSAKHLPRGTEVGPWETHRTTVASMNGYCQDSASECSSSASPQSLPPLLPHIERLGYSYPPRHSIPPGLAVARPPPSVYGSSSYDTGPKRDKKAWMDYCQVVPGKNDQNDFRCMWRVGNAGQYSDYCGYTAKRHLVKRHVETRHLQYKSVLSLITKLSILTP